MMPPTSRAARANARACRRQQGELLALLDDVTSAALPVATRAHLDACGPCRVEFGGLVLAGIAVRRGLVDARRADPPATAWPRLRARVQRRTPTTGRVGSPILGLALGAGIATSLLLPLGVVRYGEAPTAPRPTAIHEAGLDPAAILAAGRRDAAGESRWLRANALAGREVSSGGQIMREGTDLIRAELNEETGRRMSQPRAFGVSVE